MLKRRGQIGALAGGLLLLVATAVGCSSEKQAATEPPKVGVAAGKHEEPGSSGHQDKEGEAPHAHDETSGPVVALTAVERANIGLKTAKAELRPFDDIRRLPGMMKAAPDRVAVVTSRTTGKIVEIHAALGQQVQKGADLMEVQSVEVEKLQLDLLQAESRTRTDILKLETDLTQARNKLRLAQVDVDRNRLLVDKGIGARKDLITAENQLQAVQNEIAGLERQIELARLASRSEVEGLVRQLGLLGLPPGEIERMRRERVVAVLHIPAPIGGGARLGRPLDLADSAVFLKDPAEQASLEVACLHGLDLRALREVGGRDRLDLAAPHSVLRFDTT